MFSKKQFILFVSKNHVRVAHVICRRGKCRVEGIQSMHWTSDTLLGILQNIRKETGEHIRLVLDDDLAYVASFSFEKNTLYDRERIKQEAQKRIPENLDDVPWDFVHIATRIGNMKSVFNKGAQVVAVTKFFLEHIAPVLSESKFSIDVLETESCAIARQVGIREKAVLAMRENQHNTVYVIVEHGVVLMAEKISGPIRQNSIDTFLAFAKQHWNLNIRDFVVSNMTDTDLQESLEDAGFSIDSVELDAMVGMAEKTDIRGKDEDVLNVNLLPQDTKYSHWSLHPSEWVKLVVAIACLAAAGIVLQSYYTSSTKSRPQKTIVIVPKTQTPATPVVEENANNVTQDEIQNTSQPPQEIKDEKPLSAYVVTVLNGTKKKGEASAFRDMLETQGFVVENIDNAKKSSYQETVIHAKASVPAEVIAKVEGVVSSAYVLGHDDITLDEQDENDMIIIIGDERVSVSDSLEKQAI